MPAEAPRRLPYVANTRYHERRRPGAVSRRLHLLFPATMLPPDSRHYAPPLLCAAMLRAQRRYARFTMLRRCCRCH